MTPTPKLRFVERVETIYNDPASFSTGRTVRILQQWWEKSTTINLGWTGNMPIGLAKGEWRDVPIEKEQT
jgi:hypothetical protein